MCILAERSIQSVLFRQLDHQERPMSPNHVHGNVFGAIQAETLRHLPSHFHRVRVDNEVPQPCRDGSGKVSACADFYGAVLAQKYATNATSQRQGVHCRLGAEDAAAACQEWSNASDFGM